MKLLPLLCLAFAFTALTATAKDTDATLTEAIKDRLVAVTAMASGEPYNGKGLSLTIENKGKKAIRITIEPGLVFSPADSGYQQLLLAGDIKVTVAPMEHKNINLQSYCATSYATAPAKAITYHFNRQADSNIIKTLAYLKAHNTSADLAQKAVWVWTNNKDLNTVYEPAEDQASKNLIAYLSTLNRKGLPQYYNYYKLGQTPGAPAIPPKPLRIYAAFKWTLKEDHNLTLAVYNADGTTLQKLFEHQVFKPGGYELTARFESADVPSGKYYIRLTDGATTFQETAVTIE